jgi:hypothetical protein
MTQIKIKKQRLLELIKEETELFNNKLLQEQQKKVELSKFLRESRDRYESKKRLILENKD